MFKRERVLGFIRRVINAGEDPSNWCTQFRLVLAGKYETKDDDTGEIDAIVVRVPGQKKLLATPENITDRIEQQVSEQTEAIGGSVKFRLLAYCGEGKTKPKTGIFITHFHLDPDDPEESEDKLAPTRSGQIRQDQIHYERMMTIAETTILEGQRILRSENEDLRAQNQLLVGKFLQVIPVLETMLSQSHQRKLNAEEHTAKMGLLNEVGQRALIMIPHLVNWYFKMPVMATPTGDKNPAEMAIRETLSSLKPDQFFTIMNALDETQRLPVMKIYTTIVEEDEQKKAKAAEQLKSAVPSKLIPEKAEKKEEAAS